MMATQKRSTNFLFIMLTKSSVFEVSREGYSLLANQDGNNGRSMRRFLDRICPNGLALQVLAEHGGCLDEDDFDAVELTAKNMLRLNARYLSQDAQRGALGVIVERDFNLVQTAYRLPFEVATASVEELRQMVTLVVILSDNMHRFAASPVARLVDAVQGFFAHNNGDIPQVAVDDHSFNHQYGCAV